MELTSRASISSKFMPTSFFSPPMRATDMALPCSRAEVEAGEPVGAMLLTGCDGVELVFHGGGEVVVDQVGRNAAPAARSRRKRSRTAPVPNRASIRSRGPDGVDDRGVGGRPADAQLFEGFDQARLGVARRRGGGVPLRDSTQWR